MQIPQHIQECLFQEDSNGHGAEIAELYWLNSDDDINDAEVCSPRLHLNPATLAELTNRSVGAIFLTHRGMFYLADGLYRGERKPSREPGLTATMKHHDIHWPDCCASQRRAPERGSVTRSIAQPPTTPNKPKAHVTVLNQRANLTNDQGTGLSFSYAAGQNAMELQHAVEVAEKERYRGSKSGGNFNTPNRIILDADPQQIESPGKRYFG